MAYNKRDTGLHHTQGLLQTEVGRKTEGRAGVRRLVVLQKVLGGILSQWLQFSLRAREGLIGWAWR